MAAGWLEPQPDGLAALGPGRGEHAGEAAVPGDVDRMLVAASAERPVRNAPGQMVDSAPMVTSPMTTASGCT